MTVPRDNVFISTGEYSGDLLGADLARELETLWPESDFWGITGPAMRALSIESVAGIEELSVMGVVEVVRRAASLALLEKRLLRLLEERRPRVAILVDFPGFHLRLAARCRLLGIPVVQYIAPKTWAHGARRNAALARDVSLTLGMLPFETEWFQNAGVPFQFIGSPIRDRVETIRTTRAELGLANDTPLFAALPGSRMSEIARLLPRMAEVARLIRAEIPEAVFIVPMAPNLSLERFREVCPDLPTEMASSPTCLRVPSTRWRGLDLIRGKSLECMALADAAVVASGTATLECALLGTPCAIIYQVHPLSFPIMKAATTLKFVGLPNLVLGRPAFREMIQHIDIPELARELIALARPGARRDAAMADIARLRQLLPGGAAPHAARIIVEQFGPSRV
jgi:lipid-A-disaccharide synthase